MKPVRIFFSYAHEDEKFREELEKHLSFLKRNKKIIGWHDRRITGGSNWEQEINENIDKAQIILMLISPDFIASDYCFETESIRALERHKKKEAVVIPIIVRPCLWTETPFKSLQALPTDGAPISTCSNPDEAWLNVAKGLLKIVDELLRVNALKEAERMVRDRTSPPAHGNKKEEYENQLIRFLSEYKKYWFSPVKIKSMADKVPDAKGLSMLEVNIIIDYCESLTKKGAISVMYNAKGSRIYKIA